MDQFYLKIICKTQSKVSAVATGRSDVETKSEDKWIRPLGQKCLLAMKVIRILIATWPDYGKVHHCMIFVCVDILKVKIFIT